jgi:hypothetical protein
MITRLSEIIHEWMGWCPNAPAIRTAPAVLVVPPEMIHPEEPGSSGSEGSSGRIRSGISIATGSLKVMIRDRRLLWFTALAGLVILFLIAVEEWTVAHIQSSMPFHMIIPPFGESFLILDTRLFMVQVVSLFGFTILLAALILYRTGYFTSTPLTIRKAFAGIGAYTGPLAILSVMMALLGTLLFDIISRSQFFGKIIMTVSMAIFYLPYAYYLPNPLSAAIFFSVIIMVINIFLFLIALYVVPVIMLEKKGLVFALAGSLTLMKKTWPELLGCIVIYGVIVLAVAAIALVIGQSPLLLNHDYDFFLQVSRGQVLMTGVCYGFIIACWVMMAACFTTAGIAVTDLYTYGKTGLIHGLRTEKN